MQNIARPHANKCSSSRANLSSGKVFLISSWVPPLLKPLLARSALREEICENANPEVFELPLVARFQDKVAASEQSKACTMHTWHIWTQYGIIVLHI